jgi:hypothetical protein
MNGDFWNLFPVSSNRLTRWIPIKIDPIPIVKIRSSQKFQIKTKTNGKKT